MSVAELAARWDMDEDTVYLMARRRILVALQQDGTVYISRAHVEKFEDQGMTDLTREDFIE